MKLLILIFFASSLFANPVIESVESSGRTLWQKDQSEPLKIAPGQVIAIKGMGFGSGPNLDYSKVIVGGVRALERTLPMYEGTVNLLKQLFYEKPKIFDSWPQDILSWNDTQISIRIPLTASKGPLVIQIQKRLSDNPSLGNLSVAWKIKDPITERVETRSKTEEYPIARVAPPELSNEVATEIINSHYSQLVQAGEAIYWSYDYNIGVVHHRKGMDWKSILEGKAIDPVTGSIADPEKLFGAYRIDSAEVPEVAKKEVTFSPYPIPVPLKPVFRAPLYKGTTKPTGFTGYVSAESIDPLTQTKGRWVGFNCASCHAQRVSYEASPGKTVTRIFPGIPNSEWSMKWATLSSLSGVKGKEKGIDGHTENIDKTLILYYMPKGTGEHTLVRPSLDGSNYANDHLFSPIAIPPITHHLPVRAALSRPAIIAGFEGSYIHAEEPDGAIGAMRADALKQLTAYMSTLNQNDKTLQNIGIYRWLKQTQKLNEIANAGEGQFLQSERQSYPLLVQRINRGRKVFELNCQNCHAPNFGTYTDENMYTLSEVGSYFSPTLFQRQTQSVRTAILQNLFWVGKRGLLHDGHVKSLEDLVSPDRCREGSPLYQKYYTLSPSTFRIPKGNAAQEAALRNQAYFVDVNWDKENLYWDYQKMRQEFGPKELGTNDTVPLPAAPHPWCAKSKDEVDDLVAYLLTL